MTEFCWVCWSKKNSHFQGWGLLIRRCFCCSPFLASTYMKLTYQEGPESAESRILYSLEMALCGLCKFLVPDTATFHEDLCSLSWKGEFFFFFFWNTTSWTPFRCFALVVVRQISLQNSCGMLCTQPPLKLLAQWIWGRNQWRVMHGWEILFQITHTPGNIDSSHRNIWPIFQDETWWDK